MAGNKQKNRNTCPNDKRQRQGEKETKKKSSPYLTTSDRLAEQQLNKLRTVVQVDSREDDAHQWGRQQYDIEQGQHSLITVIFKAEYAPGQYSKQ